MILEVLSRISCLLQIHVVKSLVCDAYTMFQVFSTYLMEVDALAIFLYALATISTFWVPCQAHSINSVPDLQMSMYKIIDGSPCVRLLNLSGIIGCSNVGHEKVVAPLTKFKKDMELPHQSAIVVSLGEIQELLDRVSVDSKFSGNIGGVLLDPGTHFHSSGFSPATKFPNAEFSPYQGANYKWNPLGSGIIQRAFNFSVFLLSKSDAKFIQEVAFKNEIRKNKYAVNVAEFDSVMQTTKSGTHNSTSCLEGGTCLPLGGYSVWSSLPPINTSYPHHPKPIILVMASMDSASFFRDRSVGAESSMSGLITLFAVVDALSRVDSWTSSSKQIVFSVFTGEAWGYLGSRRFLHELDLNSEFVNGLNGTKIETILEIGSVGNGAKNGRKTFYAHTAGVSETSEAWKALQLAVESLNDNFTVSRASSSNPGIPPSSLMAFLRKNLSLSGLVLEDFDTVFSNRFYHSYLDDISNVNASSIVAAASLIARTLHIIATGPSTNSPSFRAIKVNESLVEALIACLLKCDPGMSCSLVRGYISPSSTCPNHYVGVFLGGPTPRPPVEYANDMSRFAWNFLAEKTSVPQVGGSHDCSQGCNGENRVCIKDEVRESGVCVISTTRYVPAYSTRLRFGPSKWSIIPANESDPMGKMDPVWTESNWDSLGLRVYAAQSKNFDHVVLLAGITLTITGYVLTVLTKLHIMATLKR